MSLTPYCQKRCLLAAGLFGFASLSLDTLAGDPSPQSGIPGTQVARYSVIQPGPALDQQDLLALTAPRQVPAAIVTVGGAVEWMLEPSGYRLVDADGLSTAVKDLLSLPLPDAHRQFEALPLKEVIALLVGPAFVLVQDPVHRLMTFEPCHDTTRQPEGSSPIQSPKPQRGHR